MSGILFNANIEYLIIYFRALDSIRYEWWDWLSISFYVHTFFVFTLVFILLFYSVVYEPWTQCHWLIFKPSAEYWITHNIPVRERSSGKDDSISRLHWSAGIHQPAVRCRYILRLHFIHLVSWISHNGHKKKKLQIVAKWARLHKSLLSIDPGRSLLKFSSYNVWQDQTPLARNGNETLSIKKREVSFFLASQIRWNAAHCGFKRQVGDGNRTACVSDLSVFCAG